MKKSTFFVVAFALALVSCGSSKQQQQYPNYGAYYPPQQYPPQYQQYPQQQQGFLDPSQMQSNESQCERLAREGWPQGKLRGYGTARSANKNMARDRAALNARNDIAVTMKALVQSFMRQYTEDFAQDGAESSADMGIQLAEQVAKQTMSGAHIIFSDFKRDGNRYEYEVCVELDKSVVEKAAMNQAAKQGIMLNAEKFREAAQGAWDRMAIEEAGYNPAVADYENQQQQRNMQMQQQQHNMQMQQQNMQMRQDRQEHNQQMQQQRMQMRQERQQHNIEMEQQRMY